MNPFILNEFEAIIKYITAAREIVQSGHMPDLKGLDLRVAALCNALAEADLETQQAFLPKLNDIIQSLNSCEDEMRAFHEAQMKGHA